MMTGILRPSRRQRGQHGDAVDLRQAEVEDHGVVGLGLAEELPLLAVEGAVDGVARMLEGGDDLLVEVRSSSTTRRRTRSVPSMHGPDAAGGTVDHDLDDAPVLAQGDDDVDELVAAAAQIWRAPHPRWAPGGGPS